MSRFSSVLVSALALVGCSTDAQDSTALALAQSAAPGDMTLVSTPLVSGSQATLTVTGADPNERVFLFRSAGVQVNGFCPPPIAPDCMDLLAPVTMTFQMTANGAGEASQSFTFPSLPPAFTEIAMQAGYIDAPTIDTSNAVLEVIHPVGSDLDGDGLSANDEVDLHGTDPNNPDSDGGGVDDGAEIAAGTDPNDPGDDTGGGALGVDDLGVGDIVITEIMYDPDTPSDGDAEYFEIYNTLGSDIDLDGLLLSQNGAGDNHAVSGSVIVPAGGYAVLGRNADTALNGDFHVDYEYSGVSSTLR